MLAQRLKKVGSMRKGKMLVLEGGNGSGKSTVMSAIEQHLLAKGLDVVLTREPGGTKISESIRELLLDPEAKEMADNTELLLFAAARSQHVLEKIKPSLESGKIVVSDRFHASTISFQHYGRGLPLDQIEKVNEMALNGFEPDITIVLDLDPVVGLERVNSRNNGLDRLEVEDIDFLHRARNGYLQQAEANPAQFAVIDASQELDKVVSDVLLVVDKTLL